MEMINVGLTNWAKHPDLLENKKIATLSEYSKHYNCVEIDSFFYGIKEAEIVKKWVDSVPKDFQFVVKASKEITKQVDVAEEVVKIECEKLKQSLAPMKSAGKLSGILLQFPGFFNVTDVNVQYLRSVFEFLTDYPIIIEFRNSSWYETNNYKKLLAFLSEQQVRLAIIDEPQTINNSIPMKSAITNKKLAFFRFHGRNINGWQSNRGFKSGSRTNYDYSNDELEQLAETVKKISENVENTIVIFNNNGGLQANKNAKKFEEILDIDPTGLGKQLELF